MKNLHKPIVASVVWQFPSGLHEVQADVVQRLGYPHRYLLFNEPIPKDTGIVLAQGPYGTLLPLARQFVGFPPERRPVLAYWFQQSLDMLRPEWARGLLARTFSDLHRYYQQRGVAGQILDKMAPDLVNRKGSRFRFLGDILWLHRSGLLDVLALSSTVYAEYLERVGITSLVVPRGYHPGFGRLLNLERDIAVVWMGKLRNNRRRNTVGWIRRGLEKRGQVMQVYDGEENAFIYGEKRTQILNRAWFVLNVFTKPIDELSIRYYLAAANGAVVITEPGENKYPFIPGEHLVECSIDEMQNKITYYLEHEEEWRAISQNMLRLMKSELTLEKSVGTILTQAEEVLAARRS